MAAYPGGGGQRRQVAPNNFGVGDFCPSIYCRIGFYILTPRSRFKGALQLVTDHSDHLRNFLGNEHT